MVTHCILPGINSGLSQKTGDSRHGLCGRKASKLHAERLCPPQLRTVRWVRGKNGVSLLLNHSLTNRPRLPDSTIRAYTGSGEHCDTTGVISTQVVLALHSHLKRNPATVARRTCTQFDGLVRQQNPSVNLSYPHLDTPFTPSLISLTVSVNVKHHVYLLIILHTTAMTTNGLSAWVMTERKQTHHPSWSAPNECHLQRLFD